MSKAVRPLPFTVIPTGKPMEKLSPRLVVCPPACVNRGRTNPTCPPIASCAVAGVAKHSNMITAPQKVAAMVLIFLSVLNIFLSISFLSSLEFLLTTVGCMK